MKEQIKFKDRVLRFIRIQPIWPILIFIIIVGAIVSRDFFTISNLSNILLQVAVNGVMAVGMTFLMINGFFDLSVGTVMGFAAALVIGMQKLGMIPALIISLAAGIAIGCINGFFVSKVKMNAFVVTLGSFIGVRGLIYIYTGEMALVGEFMGFAEFGMAEIGGFPLLALLMLVILAFGEFVLRKFRHGRNSYAIGGNAEAAKNAGIPVDRTIFLNFAISGLCAAIGGIFIASRMNAATPTLGWPDTNLIIIATVALGGTKLNGGFGSMIHTLGGLLTLGIINNIMDLLNVPSYYNMLFMGIILMLVVFADSKFKPLEH
jgi:ribose transport system permease protein